MSAHLDETMGDLRDLLNDIRQEAHGTSYGYMVGADPRFFTPDDGATDGQIASWKADCARVARGKLPLTLDPHAYGPGVTSMTDERALEWAERLERAIGQLVAIAEEGE